MGAELVFCEKVVLSLEEIVEIKIGRCPNPNNIQRVSSIR